MTIANKIDKRTFIAVAVLIIINICLKLLLPFFRENLSLLDDFYDYRKFIISILFICPVVFFVEKGAFSSLGLSLGSLRRTLTTSGIATALSLIIVFITAVTWKYLGQMRVEGDVIYFIGNQIPYKMITPQIVFILFLIQIITTAFPEELIYRGYLQSRLNFTWSPVIAIAGSSVIFTIIHIDRPLMMFHLMLMSPVLGWSFHRSKSIIPCTIAHSFGNAGGAYIIKFVALNMA